MSEVPRVDRDDPSGERRHWAVIPVPKAAVEPSRARDRDRAPARDPNFDYDHEHEHE